jgi:hypothetical protein
VAFWLIHVLPERFADKRHHVQAAAIKTRSLLSLVFAGLLWPIAWQWAFTRTVAYKVAYATDKHEDLGESAKAGGLLQGELDHLRAELDALAAKSAPPPNETAPRRSRTQPRDAGTRFAGGRQQGATKFLLRHGLVLRPADFPADHVAGVEHLSQVTALVIPIDELVARILTPQRDRAAMR